ncbi:MAG: hypothetical protein KGY60_11525 [Bacteroidales bacterium]|nr:hypothetical protein [Bacteroidales bacterium]
MLIVPLLLESSAGDRDNASVRDKTAICPHDDYSYARHTAPAYQRHWVGYAAVGYR